MQLWWKLATIEETAVYLPMEMNSLPTETRVDRLPDAAKPDHLEAALRDFVEATRELEVSQKRLSEEVFRLTEDLARSNANLRVQMAAKAKIAQDLAALISALPTGVIILQNGEVFAFNEISSQIVPDLEPGSAWQIPRSWSAIDDFHYRTRPGAYDRVGAVEFILRPETRQLEDERELLLIHDVTATFRAREEAEREAKLAAMGRMAAEIAHQLRTPLATATLYASHLADESIDPATRFSFVTPLNLQLGWLDGLVSRMMSFLRNKPGSPEMISVSELVDDCCSTIEPLFKSRKVLLNRSVQGGHHLLTAQRDQLKGGIISLLENALQVSSDNQRVSVIAVAAFSRLTITIDDEGPGIPEAILPRIFEPFASGSGRGTGLGLAIAKSAIEGHRGQLHAENRTSGGASFSVVLPVFEPL